MESSGQWVIVARDCLYTPRAFFIPPVPSLLCRAVIRANPAIPNISFLSFSCTLSLLFDPGEVASKYFYTSTLAFLLADLFYMPLYIEEKPLFETTQPCTDTMSKLGEGLG